MDKILLLLFASMLFVAWLLIPIIIEQYRRMIVPWRYDEIRDQFLKGLPAGTNPVNDDRSKTAAWHYAKLQNPGEEVVDEEAALLAQFNHYHARKRYSVPFSLILILSALMFTFIGFWGAAQLEKSPVPATATGLASTNAIVKPNTTNALGAADLERPKADPGKAPIMSSSSPPSALEMFRQIDTSIIMALLGALVWSMYEVLTRRRTGDLTPIELYDVVLRFITAIPIGYAFSLLVFDKVSPWLAFVASAFPLRDLRQLIRKQALRKTGEAPPSTSSITAQSYIGQLLSDIGDETIIRLEELNIVTCMDLAYTDPVKLMVKTGTPIKLVLAWIDKALLSVYAARHLRELERMGIPCAMDVCAFYIKHCWNVQNRSGKELGRKPGGPGARRATQSAR